MRRRIALVAVLAVIVTLAAAYVRNQRFQIPPDEVARMLKVGMRPEEVEVALQMHPGDLVLQANGTTTYIAYLRSYGVASLLFSQDMLTLEFDKSRRLSSIDYSVKSGGVDGRTVGYEFEIGTGRRLN